MRETHQTGETTKPLPSDPFCYKPSSRTPPTHPPLQEEGGSCGKGVAPTLSFLARPIHNLRPQMLTRLSALQPQRKASPASLPAWLLAYLLAGPTHSC
ncbi:hypothetical protein Pcinc_042942 [Petrolisthes cinctipes]|uniref:Uncharacterized protein n=1 Tax=Petrolisthes cinctipes TaxID=88211 RepID=A0AAE1EFG2_PETCI|nr:hypothetical protein Pcinc_042942 [Petrolisthes cinctipes]